MSRSAEILKYANNFLKKCRADWCQSPNYVLMYFLELERKGLRVAVRVLGIWHMPEFAHGNVPSMKLSPWHISWWKQSEICSSSLFLALRLDYDYNLVPWKYYLFSFKGFSKKGDCTSFIKQWWAWKVRAFQVLHECFGAGVPTSLTKKSHLENTAAAVSLGDFLRACHIPQVCLNDNDREPLF